MAADDAIFDCGLDDFEPRVLDASHKMPIMVDFWADWCAPCHAITPHLKRVMADLAGSVRLAKVEVDEGENMKLAGHYRLRGFPTVLLFIEGSEVDRFSGAKPMHVVREFIDRHLG